MHRFTLLPVLFAAVTFGFVLSTAKNVQAASPESSETRDVPALVTDRPDFTESSSAVPASHVQFEFGSHLVSGEGPTEFSPANFLVRAGLIDHLELRVGATPVTAEFGDQGNGVRGLADATLGAKVAGQISEGLRIGVIPWTTVAAPARDPSLSSGAIGTVALDAGGPVGLAANLGAGYAFGSGPDSGLQGSGSIAAGIELPAGFGTFVELYGIVPPQSAIELFADAGLTYRVAPRFQLDGFVAVGVPQLRTVAGGLGVSFIL